MIYNYIENRSLINLHTISPNLSIYNPANEQLIANVKITDTTELKDIIDKAYLASYEWRDLSAWQRAESLNRWCDLIELNKSDLAKIITLESGKPLSQALSEVKISIDFLRWFIEESFRIRGSIIEPKIKTQEIIVKYEPVGLVGTITPWNFPASMIMRKAAPAIASGCAIIVKPSELTALTALALKTLANQAGLPEYIFNIVVGNSIELAAELTSNGKIKKISFTGSTHVGGELIKQSASTIKKISMELGGDAPFIVDRDIDLSKTIDDLVFAKLRNNGQTCICPNKIFIHADIYDQFIENLIAKLKILKIGEGINNSDIGPIISKHHLDRISDLLEDAINNKAKLLYGGNKINRSGYFFEPTVITLDITSKATINYTEIFGPIFNIYKFNDIDHVIELANKSKYGLAAYIYSNNEHIIRKFVSNLECGMIGVNEVNISQEIIPFGGVKQSGFGREGSYLGIYEYMNVKYICRNIKH